MARPIRTPVSVESEGMYQSAPKIHPREIDGRFQRLRIAAVFWLLGMFYLAPWVSWGGRQAVLFDLPARRFHVLGLEFWPQDFFYLTLLLMIAAFSLFFFTALAGRLWCGYACPQTVWTEVFLWIERWFEGTRNQRYKLDEAPWGWDKLRRRGGKQLAWIVLSLWTGFTFVGFFTPIRELAHGVATNTLGHWELFWGLFYGFATYGNAGFLREQVCKYMCPYARFQGAMFDRDTLVISYDAVRGEPRGARRRGTPSVLSGARTGELGDCISCDACVQVCPTGIDIRNGLQYECIACGACVDACDAVMDKMQYPRGLVRYSTQNAIEGKPGRVLRPRIVVYALVLGVLVGGFGWSMASRVPLRLDVLRDRNALYRLLADGSVENVYTLKIANQSRVPMRYRLSLEGAEAVTFGRSTPQEIDVPADTLLAVPVTLAAPAGAVHGKVAVAFRVEATTETGQRAQQKSSFFGPF